MQPDLSIIGRCAKYIGFTESEVLAIAATAPLRYKVYPIAKRSGSGTRIISHPARELKALQYFFLEEIFPEMRVSAFATAYVQGSSIKKNAHKHRKSRVILKMDFSNFFGSIKSSNWQLYVSKHFPVWTKEEYAFSERVLFCGNGQNIPKCLAIGAPTSPSLSNAVMYDFDIRVASYCQEREIYFSRYADDMTFSSTKFLNVTALKQFIRRICKSYEGVELSINHDKTVLASKAFSRRITGIIITNHGDLSIGRERKRLIRAAVHHAAVGKLDSSKSLHIQGLLGFAADVEPTFLETLRRKYGRTLIANLMRGPAKISSRRSE